MSVNSELCDACRSLAAAAVRDEKSNDVKHDFHPNATALFKAADSGCPICKILREYFFDRLQKALVETPGFEHDPHSFSLRYQLVHHQQRGRVSDPYRWHFQFFKYNPRRMENSRDPYENGMEHVGNIAVNHVDGETFQNYYLLLAIFRTNYGTTLLDRSVARPYLI